MNVDCHVDFCLISITACSAILTASPVCPQGRAQMALDLQNVVSGVFHFLKAINPSTAKRPNVQIVENYIKVHANNSSHSFVAGL